MKKNLFIIAAVVFFAIILSMVAFSFTARDNVVYFMAVEAFKRNDYKNAFREFLSLAEKGDQRAAGAVGLMYINGMGVDVNETVGAAWLSSAADNRDAEATHSLGELYAQGIGVPQSRVMAQALYIYSAELGSEAGRVFKGRMAAELPPADAARAERIAKQFSQDGSVTDVIERHIKKRHE